MSVALAGALALAGWVAGWLTRNGAIAATFVGGAVFAGGGWPGGVLLALFFISGSLLTAMAQARRRKRERVARNSRQVLANGLWPAVAALLVPFHPGLGWAVFSGSLATALADTWATEIGSRSKTLPRLMTTGTVVTPGTSGGITPLGTAGGTIGAMIFALVTMAVGLSRTAAGIALIAGAGGMLVDSLLGATAQGRFTCDACGTATEQRTHTCGRKSRLIQGWAWLDNDAVNFLATGAGGTAGALLSLWR